jgi:hypothetical protein
MQISEHHISNRYPRLMGIVSILVGLIIAKWQVYDPLHAAEQHLREITIYSGLIGLGVFMPPYGLLLLLFGRKPNQWFAFDPQNLKWKNVVSLLAFGAAGMVAIFYVIGRLEAQGYHVRHFWGR